MRHALIATTLIAIILAGIVLTGSTFSRWTVSQVARRDFSICLTEVVPTSTGTFRVAVKLSNPSLVPILVSSHLTILRWNGRTIGADGAGGLDLVVPAGGASELSLDIESNLRPELLPPQGIEHADERWNATSDIWFTISTRRSQVRVTRAGAMEAPE